jgi:hypothetical protein
MYIIVMNLNGISRYCKICYHLIVECGSDIILEHLHIGDVAIIIGTRHKSRDYLLSF